MSMAMTCKKERGLAAVITGEGKGKTTAALGMAMRALGHGFPVVMIQFIKGSRDYGELTAAARFSPSFEILPMGRGFVHVNPGNPDREDVEAARKAWQEARERILSGRYFMVILDEINNAVSYGLLPAEEVVEMIKARPDGVNLVLTGRDAHPDVIAAADLVSEVREIKHPYRQGIRARKGIEF